jgi:hypothetical protein
LEPVDTPEQLARMQEAFGRVFGDSPRGSQPFAAEVRDRVFVYEIDYTMLDAQQFHAVSAAALTAGDSEAYLAGLGALDTGWEATYDHALVTLDDFEDYRADNALILEHALFSPRGAWGVVTSDARYAVAAGDSAFAEVVRSRLGRDDEAMLWSFLGDWLPQPGFRKDWLAPFIAHLRGEQSGARIWDRAQALRRD